LNSQAAEREDRNKLSWASRLPTVKELSVLCRLAVSHTVPFFVIAIPMFVLELFTLVRVGSGLTLKGLTRLVNMVNRAPKWFYRKFDNEKKPLQSIGLVAGALVALMYWVALIVDRVLT
jgi:hypothetical protein